MWIFQLLLTSSLFLFFLFYSSRTSCVMAMITLIIIVALLCQICRESAFSRRVFHPIARSRLVFLFIPGRGAPASSVCPPDCSQGIAISGSQYNASPVPSEATMQNGKRNPSTCLPGWGRVVTELRKHREREREREKQTNKE